MKKLTSKFTGMALAASALLVVITSSCSKNNNDVTLPPIGGYNNADEVAAANLVAHWAFDGDLKESVSGDAGTGTNTAFTTGKKGQAYQGSSTEARYAIYNASAGVKALNSYTFTMWINSDSMKKPLADPTQGYGAQGIFTLANAADFWGGINIFIENRGDNDGDSLKFKVFTNNTRAGVNWKGQSPIVWLPAARNQWVHVAVTYDATASRFTAYINGAQAGKIDIPYGPATGGTYVQYADDPGDINNTNGAALQGDLVLPASTQMAIGTHQFTTTPPLNTGGTLQPWATTYAGLLDEFRIYNKALSMSEVNSLYQLESAGR
jgi:hypothetical protein